MNTQGSARMSRSQLPSSVAHRSAICPSQRILRSDRVSTRAFLSNLFGGGGNAGNSTDPRGAELRNELVLLTLNTNYGASANSDKKKQIADTVSKLARYSVKSPLKSPLLWGDYEVLYSSSPSAEASLLGFSKLSGTSRQILEAPNKLTNVSEFKTLGVLPGFAKQFGEIQPVSDDTFQLNLTRSESKGGLGGVETKPLDISRRIKVAYLDATLRVVSILPGASTTTLIDSEFDEEPDKQEVLLIFRRVADQQQRRLAASDDDEEEDEEEEEAPAAKAKQPIGTQIFGRFLPAAVSVEDEEEQQDFKVTQRGGANLKWANKQVSSLQAKDERAKAAVAKLSPQQLEAQRAKQAAADAKAKEQAAAQRAREQAAEARAREQARAQQIKEQETAKARAEQERARAAAEKAAERERAEAEKEKERQRAAAVKAQQQELAEDVKDASAAVREAQADLKSIERESAPVVKSLSSAESQLSKAAADVRAAEEELAAAAEQRRAAEAALKAALAEVAEAEAELRSKLVFRK